VTVVASRFVLLSHPLRADSPVWPGNPAAARVEATDSIERGDVVNTSVLELFSHSGTHVDTPWHFDAAGPAAWQLPIERFVFESPRLVAVPAGAGELVTREALATHAATVAGADLLMLRTGWGAERDRDPIRYARDGPMLHPDAARWLIDEHPDLRAIATDAISIGSPRHLDATTEVHRILAGAGRTDGRFVLVYEDVHLVPEAAWAIRVYAWPLLVEGADGSPLTIVAELRDEPGRSSTPPG
jgi:arylformamidase